MILTGLGYIAEGYHQFGFNRKQQLRQIMVLPFAAAITAWICTLL